MKQYKNKLLEDAYVLFKQCFIPSQEYSLKDFFKEFDRAKQQMRIINPDLYKQLFWDR